MEFRDGRRQALILILAGAVLSGPSAMLTTAEEKPVMHAPTVRPFGKLPDGRDAHLYVLETPGGWRATITDYGAILTSMTVPLGKDGPEIGRASCRERV